MRRKTIKNKIEDLKKYLFATLEALQDVDNPMEIDRAKAVSDVASIIIESAKVETKFLEVLGAQTGGTGLRVNPNDRH